MAGVHIEFTLSFYVCMFGCVFVFLFQNSVWPITSACIVGYKNKLAQVIIRTRQCVANKNPVARSKVKVTNT